jgi:hypothetical protein
LKINDEDYKPLNSLPYGIRKSGAELGEPLFTLGYPRDEIVYNEGYMSAKTGLMGIPSASRSGYQRTLVIRADLYSTAWEKSLA